jgi:hypothetical protein
MQRPNKEKCREIGRLRHGPEIRRAWSQLLTFQATAGPGCGSKIGGPADEVTPP